MILIATGTEVHLCVNAAELLEADGIAATVVSMPCIENSADQPQDYRDIVLLPSCRARVSVEAAATLGWHRWVGDLGEATGMEGLGASALVGALCKYFGFTAERIAETSRRVLERAQGSS